jgi:hypothetical protein
VRPLPVLRQAFALVSDKWAAEGDYAYACEQLKSIRQDLTVQHLTSADSSRAAFATEVYEAHARIALAAGDLGEFGACQAALVPLHATHRSAHAAEFVAYRLLHAAAISRTLASLLHPTMSSLRPGEREHPAVAQALRLAIALESDDLLRLLRELPSVANLGVKLLLPRLPRIRERALHMLCKAHAPTLPLLVLSRSLGFADDTRLCERWLRTLGAVPSYRSGKNELEIDTKMALSTLNARERESGRLTDTESCGPAIPHGMLSDSGGEA